MATTKKKAKTEEKHINSVAQLVNYIVCMLVVNKKTREIAEVSMTRPAKFVFDYQDVLNFNDLYSAREYWHEHSDNYTIPRGWAPVKGSLFYRPVKNVWSFFNDGTDRHVTTLLRLTGEFPIPSEMTLDSENNLVLRSFTYERNPCGLDYTTPQPKRGSK